MFHARDDLLPDVAAFAEIDAVEKVEVGVVGKSVAIGEIDAALGRGDADAQRLVGRDRVRPEAAPPPTSEGWPASRGEDRAGRRRRRRPPTAGGGSPQKATTPWAALSSAIATFARNL